MCPGSEFGGVEPLAVVAGNAQLGGDLSLTVEANEGMLEDLRMRRPLWVRETGHPYPFCVLIVF